MLALSTSLVVPGVSVTIALSSIRRVLKSELFPAFGVPTIATSSPRLSSFALLASLDFNSLFAISSQIEASSEGE